MDTGLNNYRRKEGSQNEECNIQPQIFLKLTKLGIHFPYLQKAYIKYPKRVHHFEIDLPHHIGHWADSKSILHV